jgi:GMP synthase (glutamine-hydrolysing)
MKELIILKTGETIPTLLTKRGDFEDWILAGMGIRRSSARIVPVFKGSRPPEIKTISGIVITGSPYPVTNKTAWSERTALWLSTAASQEIPILGICYGHQILAYSLGGRIADTLLGPEYGTIKIKLTEAAKDDPLFSNLSGTFEIQSSHYQAVIDLPHKAILLGASKVDPHAAYRYGEHVWGVQFHPEFDAEITAAYIHHHRERIEKSNLDFRTLLSNCRDTNSGKMILRNFAEVCGFRK